MMGQASGVQKSERRQRINTVIDHQFTPKLITDVFGYGGWNTRLIKGSLQPLQQSHPWVIRLLLRPAAHHYLGNTFDEHFARLGNMAANTHRKATQDTALPARFGSEGFVIYPASKRQYRTRTGPQPVSKLRHHCAGGCRVKCSHEHGKIGGPIGADTVLVVASR